jgi:TetR/AcrR family transcriptional regulator
MPRPAAARSPVRSAAPRRAAPRPPAPSRDRLLAAAAEAFASRGFDGAKVDRIAARARLNKAMLYYHFRNKAALYREVLVDLFRAVARSVALVREQGGPPDDQLRRFVAVIAHEAVARPHFPAMWLRELADGGRHIDEPVVLQMRVIIETLAAVLDDGRRAGLFHDANPFVVHLSIVAPLLLMAATARVRDRFQHLVPATRVGLGPEAAVAHVQAMALAALTAGVPGPRAAPPRRHRS